MKCDYCEFAIECRDPSQLLGGCDIDGVDDFGNGFVNDDDCLTDDNDILLD